jgi:hypothetical protein
VLECNDGFHFFYGCLQILYPPAICSFKFRVGTPTTREMRRGVEVSLARRILCEFLFGLS